jgi:hypothetical protein
MTRTLAAAIVALSFCTAARADVTLRATSTGQGAGPVAAAMSRMGAIRTTTVIDANETAPLDDALFLVPADYTLQQR